MTPLLSSAPTRGLSRRSLQQSGGRNWRASWAKSPCHRHAKATDERKEKLLLLALDICREPRGMSGLELAAVWAFFLALILGPAHGVRDGYQRWTV